MTYFAFLLLFLGLPIAGLAWLASRDVARGRQLPAALHSWPPAAVIGLLVLIALLYTTPWDNYLVATRVWWYEPELVTGITLGWVPLEEYTFFIVQPIFTGLLWLALARRLPLRPRPAWASTTIRAISTALAVVIGLGGTVALLMAWEHATYAALELSWAALPIAIQLAFGADILWRYREMVLAACLISTTYLAAADALAIGSGTWTIDPQQSCGVLIAGILPLEEVLFFGLTNALVVFGMTLALAQESQSRLPFAAKTAR